MYRLVVTLDHGEVTFQAPPFRHFKRARAHVAEAIWRHARDGVVQRVTLECRRPPIGPVFAGRTDAALAGTTDPRAGEWSVVTWWESDVIERILRQRGMPSRTLPAASPHRPHRPTTARHQSAIPKYEPIEEAAAMDVKPEPTESPIRPPNGAGRNTPAQSSVPKVPTTSALPLSRPKSYRGHLLITALIVVFAWIAAGLILTGGRPVLPFQGDFVSEPAVANELPFNAP